ncbi:MAG: glycosyltransferase [Bacteroidales bacterium]|nr:glycosyltransferase [Bacteroidales bacterium]
MTLSVVIVNYNVKYFLDQCLASVFGSNRQLANGEQMELEVWVVDNDSVDGSASMIRTAYPQVKLIENHQNVGFSKANNQALLQATGDVLLLLNPDTIVEPNTLCHSVDFMQSHADCGGLCVKMIDGKGNYMKESKRGFPTPSAAFCKIVGLTSLFPHSRRMAAYYMGHLPANEVNKIDIMPGAYMMIRREVYDKIGGLDEQYFMYGEDVDYSWRIKQAGYENYYLPEPHIIHYKGESTRKGSLNYVFTFYNAMSIFVNTHFDGPGAKFYNIIIHIAIWLRATMAWCSRIAKRMALPLLDFACAYGGFILIKHLWATFWASNIHYYPPEYTTLVIPLYILILMLSAWLGGGYDTPYKPMRMTKGMLVGMVMLLAFYSLLNEEQRYSRMLLLAGSLWTIVSTQCIRLVCSFLHLPGYTLRHNQPVPTLIIGSDKETTRVTQLYTKVHPSPTAITTTSDTSPNHLQDIIRINHIIRVIFCAHDIGLEQIIHLMAELKTTGVEYTIAPKEGEFIIGSDSVFSKDSALVSHIDTISTPLCKRQKRLFDIVSSTMLLMASPIMILLQHHRGTFYAHIVQVLTGKKTWVGYVGHEGVFDSAQLHPNADSQMRRQIELQYMHTYRLRYDATILWHNLRNI